MDNRTQTICAFSHHVRVVRGLYPLARNSRFAQIDWGDERFRSVDDTFYVFVWQRNRPAVNFLNVDGYEGTPGKRKKPAYPLDHFVDFRQVLFVDTFSRQRR